MNWCRGGYEKDLRILHKSFLWRDGNQWVAINAERARQGGFIRIFVHYDE
jgi:hypothetical protein